MKRFPQEKDWSKGYGRPYEIISQEDVCVDKKVVKRSNTTMFDPKEFFSQYDAADFYLENIIAAGAVSGLKECKLYQGKLMSEDEVLYEISKMSDALDREVTANAMNVNNNDVKNDVE